MARTKITTSQLDTGIQGNATNPNATTTSTTYTTNLSDAVTTSATAIVPSSGKVLVSLSAYFFNSGAFIGFMCFSASGANTIAASDYNGIQHKMNSNDGTVGSSFLLAGLTPGSTTFTLNYRCTGGTETLVS